MPKGRRGREIVRAICGATRRILEEEGFDALTTNRIAEVAGVSIGSLYQYFPDKRSVIAELARDTEAKALALVEERVGALEPDDIEGLVRELVGILFDPLFGSMQLRRSVQVQIPPVWFAQTSQDVDRTVHQVVSEFLARNAAILRPGMDPDLAAFVLLNAGERVVEAAVADPAQRFDLGELRAELEWISLRYLRP